MALIVLSVVEQRLDAVRAVLAGAEVTEVADRLGVHRATVHRWVARYLTEQIGGLTDRSHRPANSPRQVPAAMEALVVEIRRQHPRWGAKRIRLELLRSPGPWARPEVAGIPVPAVRTIVRILHRHGLAQRHPRKRPRESYVRFERPGPMQMWGIDIVGGIQLVDVGTGELREAKILTGVDDHSRYCVIAKVMERATSRAVCIGFAEALTRFGVPEEVITDNGKQFTDRFGQGGEVLFDKICRRNGITHRLTAPASPNQNGKVERFHGTMRPDLLNDAGPFESVDQAQAAVDAWVSEYNRERPHQGLDDQVPVMPAQRFTPVPAADRELVELWLPPSLEPVAAPAAAAVAGPASESAEPASVLPAPAPTTRGGSWSGGPIEFDRRVPGSGNLGVAGKQFWVGPARAGQMVRFWADCDQIHLSCNGVRIKSLRSHLSAADLTRLVAQGAVAAGPSPFPAADGTTAIEVDRTVNATGIVSLLNRPVLAADILAGRRVSIRIEPEVLMFFDPETRELLRTRPNPFGAEQVIAIQGARPAGPPPRPSVEPIRVQRRVWSNGRIMVTGQRLTLGRDRAGQTVTVLVSDATLTVEFEDGEPFTVRRTSTKPIRRIKAQRPRDPRAFLSGDA